MKPKNPPNAGKPLFSPEDEKANGAAAEAMVHKLNQMVVDEGLERAMATAMGTMFGVTHFLKHFGQREIFREIRKANRKYFDE